MRETPVINELSYEDALSSLNSFTAPTEPFPNQNQGTERLPIFNKVVNKSDLYSLQKIKEAERQLKELERQEAERKMQIREQQKEKIANINAILVASHMVKCGCKSEPF